MALSRSILNILNKLINGASLTSSEIKEIKKLLYQRNSKELFEQWFKTNWSNAEHTDLEIDFNNLKNKLIDYERSQRFKDRFYLKVKSLNKSYQKIAAILFIPILLSVTFLITRSISSQPALFVAEAPLGQKAKVILPDSTAIWLNSGSRISYSTKYNMKTRDVVLSGEAFFDVKKNTGKPFFVHTPYIDIEVTGTQFNVNAYSDEPTIETSLIHGHVNVHIKEKQQMVELFPGKSLTYIKSSTKISTHNLNKEATISWKENCLVFINDDFDKLARKVEKWYNMKLVYNKDDFKENKLTVKLKEGEQLNKLLNIIESAIHAECKIDNNLIYITKK